MENQVNFEAITTEDLAQILARLFQPNTEEVKKATALLKEYFKKI